MVPQSFPCAVQVVGEQAVHWWLMASHASLAGQVGGQMSVAPQPSDTVPQAPSDWHVAGTQGLHLCVSPSQTSPAGQLPQMIRFPHASPMTPQSYCLALQMSLTHWCDCGSHEDFAVASHVPHARV